MPTFTQRRQLLAIAFGAGYGIAVRLLYQLQIHYSNGTNQAIFGLGVQVMTVGFLVFVPAVMGWLTIANTGLDDKFHWTRWIFLPWVAVLLADLGLLATLVEGVICIIFAVPITLFFGSIGGIAAGLNQRARLLRGRATTACLAILPLLVSAAETRFQPPLDLRTVHTSIVIHASPETVWNNIKRVPAIQPGELRATWTHSIGFPLPVEATLDHERVGGVRHASFEHGLLFIETVTRWEPNQDLAFTIAADTAHIPPATLDEHVTIGGRYFDVLNGEYRLEPLPDGSILLHLTSQERLNTDFNGYARLWTDAVMSDLQQSILEVVKHRCESVTRQPSATLNP